MSLVRKSDFFFELHEDQIAKYPLKKRDQSKLLCYQNGHVIVSQDGKPLDVNVQPYVASVIIRLFFFIFSFLKGC